MGCQISKIQEPSQILSRIPRPQAKVSKLPNIKNPPNIQKTQNSSKIKIANCQKAMRNKKRFYREEIKSKKSIEQKLIVIPSKTLKKNSEQKISEDSNGQMPIEVFSRQKQNFPLKKKSKMSIKENKNLSRFDQRKEQPNSSSKKLIEQNFMAKNSKDQQISFRIRKVNEVNNKFIKTPARKRVKSIQFSSEIIGLWNSKEKFHHSHRERNRADEEELSIVNQPLSLYRNLFKAPASPVKTNSASSVNLIIPKFNKKKLNFSEKIHPDFEDIFGKSACSEEYDIGKPKGRRKSSLQSMSKMDKSSRSSIFGENGRILKVKKRRSKVKLDKSDWDQPCLRSSLIPSKRIVLQRISKKPQDDQNIFE
jgi:hypothetical protein